MSVQTGKFTNLEIQTYEGLSNEIRPVLKDHNNGSSFWCVDTGDYYKWMSGQWYLQ